MDKQFDFSKFDDREEFRDLQKEEQEKMIGDAQEDAEKTNKEIDRLTDEIINSKRKARTARNDAAREVYEEKVVLSETELQQIKQEHNKTDQREKENERQKKFDELLKGKFDKVSYGRFETTLTGVDSLVVRKGPINPESNEIESLEITPYGEKDYHKLFTLYKDGQLMPDNVPMPRTFNFTAGELYDEVLDIAERMGINSDVPSISVDDDILPPDIFQFPEGEGDGQDIIQPIDSRRRQFMENHPDLLFTIQGRNSSERGYYGFIFPKFLVLENNTIGNAAFFFDFESPLPVNSERKLEKVEIDDILINRVKPILNLTKSEFAGVGGQGKRHPSVTMDDEHWTERMQAEIDSRS